MRAAYLPARVQPEREAAPVFRPLLPLEKGLRHLDTFAAEELHLLERLSSLHRLRKDEVEPQVI